jgi:hypothetical protein
MQVNSVAFNHGHLIARPESRRFGFGCEMLNNETAQRKCDRQDKQST